MLAALELTNLLNSVQSLYVYIYIYIIQINVVHFHWLGLRKLKIEHSFATFLILTKLISSNFPSWF